MDFLRLFSTENEYDLTVEDFEYPTVSYVTDTDKVYYMEKPPHDYSKDYLTFKALTAGTILWKSIGTGMAKTIEYSINNGAWTSITATSAGEPITVAVNDMVRLRGTNSTYAKDKSNYSGFEGGTATYDIEGNIMSLLYGDNFVGNNTLTGTYNFCSMFKLSNSVSAENMILPATTLVQNCYQGMFNDCTGLTTAPELPAIRLANYCYSAMFYGCTSLTIAPELPATTLASGCYSSMFKGCTSLTTAPVLPATTLANSCYGYMFDGCTSLTTAPVLPATTLVTYCYYYMFKDCTRLNYIKAMFTTTPSKTYTENWVSGVASTGTFVKNSAATWTTTGVNGIPTGWTVETASA